MAHKLTLTLGCIALFLSPVCLAAPAPPSNVVNVTAMNDAGNIKVSWSAATDPTGISNYRIYYSKKSILENQGNYDDFHQTSGPVTSYTFDTLPPHDGRLFVSVLAVNTAGVESEGFASEAFVDIAPSAEPSVTAPGVQEQRPPVPELQAESAVTERSTTTAEPMAMLSVSAVTSTGVVVTFSKPIAADGVAITAFHITDTGGTALELQGIEISGTVVLVKTLPQMPEKLYILTIAENVRAEDGTNATASTPSVMFPGFGVQIVTAPVEPVVETIVPTPEPVAYGKNPATPVAPYVQAPPAVRLPPEDAVGLTLSPTRRGSGVYDVLARWAKSPDTQNTLDVYGLYTATEGAGFAWTGPAEKGATTARFSSVRPGMFSVRITARDAEGRESQGIVRTVSLPASGAGLFGIAAASGFLASRRRRKKE